MVDDFVRGAYILEHPDADEQAIDTLSVIWARAICLPVDRGIGKD